MATRIEALDGARGVAALAVVAHHIFQQRWVGTFPAPIEHLMAWLGWWGVTFFFLLSGFCIHYPKARARSQGDFTLDRYEFIRDRLYRVFPAFIVVLAISGVVGMYLPTNLVSVPRGWLDVAAHILFVHNFFPDSVYSINAVLWSLGIEMQFYILYALLYRRLRFTWFENAITLGAGLAWYAVASFALTGAERFAAQRIFLVTFWVWHLGGVLARQYVTRRPEAAPIPFVLALVITLALSQVDPVVARLHIVFWVAPFAMAALLWFWLPLHRAPLPLHFVGLISYSLYLLHPIAIALVTIEGLLATATALTLAIAFAAASYRWVELPGVALKHERCAVGRVGPGRW